MLTVIAPMEQELTGLRRALAARRLESVDLHVVGIGKEEAQSNVSRILESSSGSRDDELLLVGFAGGLDPSLKVGDLVVPNYFYAEDGDVIAADSEMWQESRVAAVESAVSLVQGNSLTVNKIVLSAEEKRDLYRDHQVSSVNMEDFWVAQIAADAEVPFLSVRAILDPAGQALPGYVLGLAGHPIKAALRVIPRPWRLPVILELARGRNLARASLTRLAMAIINRQKSRQDQQLVGVG